MSRIADVPDDFVTDLVSINCRLGEELSVCASPAMVIVEIADGREAMNAHLTIEQARQHIAHVGEMVAAAERLHRQYPWAAEQAVLPLDVFRWRP